MAVIVCNKTGALRVVYTEWTGKRVAVTCPKNMTKKQAEKWHAKLQIEHNEIRRGFRPPPSTANKKLFVEALQEYLAWGNTQGGKGGRPWSPVHAKNRPRFLKYWAERLELKVLADLIGSVPRIEAALRDLQTMGVGQKYKTGKEWKKPLSGKTLNEYQASLIAFCHWCEERDYLDKNPLKGLAKFHASPTTHRRALTAEEIRSLLSLARPRHAVLYATAIFTGLRANELQSVTISDFNPDAGGIILRPEWTKNRQPGFQPIPPFLVTMLKGLIIGRDTGPLFDWRFAHNAARVLESDLGRADIKKWAPGGKIDFHSLRVTFTSLVLATGATVKESMELVRHSRPELTLNVYGRTTPRRLVEIVNEIGERIQPSEELKKKAGA